MMPQETSPEESRPEETSPYHRYAGLRLQFDKLSAQPDELMKGAKAMLSGQASGLYITDLFMIGVLKRSIDLVSAIKELVLSWNLVAAIPLLRIHLDTMLRVSYVFEERDGEDVARRAFRGGAVQFAPQR